MYFLVNAYPPEPVDVATSNFADALVRLKAGICDGVPSTEVQLLFSFIVTEMKKTVYIPMQCKWSDRKCVSQCKLFFLYMLMSIFKYLFHYTLGMDYRIYITIVKELSGSATEPLSFLYNCNI